MYVLYTYVCIIYLYALACLLIYQSISFPAYLPTFVRVYVSIFFFEHMYADLEVYAAHFKICIHMYGNAE